MPTGYTHDVQDGAITELKEFAMQCSRAFGALIHMRDEPLNASITDPKDNVYYNKHLENAKDRLYDLYNSTDEDLQKLSDKEHKESEEFRLKNLERIRTYRNRYEDMLSKVHNWEPPTNDHVGLKEFMVEQLNDSIKFDCNESHYETPTKKLPLSDWFDLRKASFLRDVDYYQKNKKEDSERNNNKKKWIQDLRDSL